MVCRFVLYVTTVLLFGILAINVFLRYLSSTSLKAGGEAPELIFPWMVMAWGTFTLMPIVSAERTPVLGVPSSVTYSCFLAAFVLLVLTALTQTLRMHLTQGMHGRHVSSGQSASAFAEH
jgi:TRAP-type C4-dicarboxylate transport system permease small subunit